MGHGNFPSPPTSTQGCAFALCGAYARAGEMHRWGDPCVLALCNNTPHNTPNTRIIDTCA